MFGWLIGKLEIFADFRQGANINALNDCGVIQTATVITSVSGARKAELNVRENDVALS
jgi:hypothetical protein